MDTQSCKIIENLLNTTASWAYGRPVAEIFIDVAIPEVAVKPEPESNLICVGVENPLVFVIGEESKSSVNTNNVPFAGDEAQLLDNMLSAIQLSKNSNCYIASFAKCTSSDTTPFSPEMEKYATVIQERIAMLKPRIILAVGRVAAQCLLNMQSGIAEFHGQFFDYKSTPFMATYHPSALLREPNYKKIAWDDLKHFKAKLQGICPGYEQSFINSVHG